MRVNEGAARGPEGCLYHVSNQRCGSVLFTRRNRHAELTPCASPVTGWSEGLAARGQMAGSWRAATASDVMIQEALSCVSVGGDPAAEICPPQHTGAGKPTPPPSGWHRTGGCGAPGTRTAEVGAGARGPAPLEALFSLLYWESELARGGGHTKWVRS